MKYKYLYPNKGLYVKETGITYKLKLEITILLENINSSALALSYIQDGTGYLKAMLQYFEGEKLIDKNQIQKLAIGLGRLITDDYEFYKSDIGVMITKTINQVLSAEDLDS